MMFGCWIIEVLREGTSSVIVPELTSPCTVTGIHRSQQHCGEAPVRAEFVYPGLKSELSTLTPEAGQNQ